MSPRRNSARRFANDPDPWLQSSRGRGHARSLGPVERKASVSDLLALTVRVESPADPRRHGAALYASHRALSLELSRRSAAPTKHPRSFSRRRGPPAALSRFPYASASTKIASSARLGLQSVRQSRRPRSGRTVARHCQLRSSRLAPSNEMFADGVRLAGLDLLSRLRIREGMTLCVSVLEPERWGERANRSRTMRFSISNATAPMRSPFYRKVKEARVQYRRCRWSQTRPRSDQVVTHFDKGHRRHRIASKDTPDAGEPRRSSRVARRTKP